MKGIESGKENKRNKKTESCFMYMMRVGQNHIITPYMTVYMVNSLPKIPYTHRIYIWFWPTLET